MSSDKDTIKELRAQLALAISERDLARARLTMADTGCVAARELVASRPNWHAQMASLILALDAWEKGRQ